MFRFRIPNNIIIDLGSNFGNSEFFDFCEQRSIQIKYASVAHPRSNGHVERANGMILDVLWKKVFDKSEKLTGKWIRELPYVVCSLRTCNTQNIHQIQVLLSHFFAFIFFLKMENYFVFILV
jgi:transposase InsO family protein